jgi:hypothetical protein
VEYGKKHANDIPQTWIALKRVMQARFVPSYYARDLINKLQQLKHPMSLLPQIQQLGRPQQQRVLHHSPSLLHLQAKRETSNVTAAKGLDMLCMIAPPSAFWL